MPFSDGSTGPPSIGRYRGARVDGEGRPGELFEQDAWVGEALRELEPRRDCSPSRRSLSLTSAWTSAVSDPAVPSEQVPGRVNRAEDSR